MSIFFVLHFLLHNIVSMKSFWNEIVPQQMNLKVFYFIEMCCYFPWRIFRLAKFSSHLKKLSSTCFHSFLLHFWWHGINGKSNCRSNNEICTCCIKGSIINLQNTKRIRPIYIQQMPIWKLFIYCITEEMHWNISILTLCIIFMHRLQLQFSCWLDCYRAFNSWKLCYIKLFVSV